MSFSSRRRRLTALTMARSEAVRMLSWRPTPQLDGAVAGLRLDVGDGGGARSRRRRRARSSRSRRGRRRGRPGGRRRRRRWARCPGPTTVRCSPLTVSWAVTVAPLEPVVVSWEMSSTDPSTGKWKYSDSNASHMRTGEISVPVSSLIVWIGAGELDLQPAGEVEAVLGLHDVGHAALARLAVDPDDGLVAAADVLAGRSGGTAPPRRRSRVPRASKPFLMASWCDCPRRRCRRGRRRRGGGGAPAGGCSTRPPGAARRCR